MGHAYTGEFHRSFLSLCTDPTSCPCDNETHNQHRDIITKAFPAIDLSTILGTAEGIVALADFISKAGAFSRTGVNMPTPSTPSPDLEPDPNIEEPRWTQDDGG